MAANIAIRVNHLILLIFASYDCDTADYTLLVIRLAQGADLVASSSHAPGCAWLTRERLRVPPDDGSGVALT
jgi:hypothetical protein